MRGLSLGPWPLPFTSLQIIAVFGELRFGRTGGTKPQLCLSKERASDKPLSRPKALPSLLWAAAHRAPARAGLRVPDLQVPPPAPQAPAPGRSWNKNRTGLGNEAIASLRGPQGGEDF